MGKSDTHWADDIIESYVSEFFINFAPCDYCGMDRSISLWENSSNISVCESRATLSKEEREEVRRTIDQPVPYELVKANDEPLPCPNPEYDGSIWDYCGEGFRVTWSGRYWSADSIHGVSHIGAVDPVVLMVSKFWTLIEPGGCVSTHEKPMKRNPNKAPDIKVPWDPGL